jgi:hypothetical protein
VKTILYVAKLIADGTLNIEGATTIETEPQAVFAKEGRNYIDDYYLDCERLGPDKYEFELDEQIFDVEEVKAYIAGPYAEQLAAYNKERQAAVAMVAQLIEQVTPAMNELLTLANKYNIPANIKVGKYTNDFRLIDAVDWDSSSMYC